MSDLNRNFHWGVRVTFPVTSIIEKEEDVPDSNYIYNLQNLNYWYILVKVISVHAINTSLVKVVNI